MRKQKVKPRTLTIQKNYISIFEFLSSSGIHLFEVVSCPLPVIWAREIGGLTFQSNPKNSMPKNTKEERKIIFALLHFSQ